jgi:hypothetical protein
MGYFRFTIRQLLVATVLVAFACATVLHPSHTLLLIWIGLSWAGFVALVAAAIINRDFYRRASIGAMIFCGLQTATLSFEMISGEQDRAAYWEVLGFRLDGCFELWNVPERRTLQFVPGALHFGNDQVDPADTIVRDTYLLGILRWQWLWIMAGMGWALGGFATKPVQSDLAASPNGERFHWLYIVAITALWIVCWQLFYYELRAIRLSGASPRQMWSTFIPSVVLWSWQTLTLLAILGGPWSRQHFSIVSAATGLWLAMAFFPGWSATLGDFLPQAMCARAFAPSDAIPLSVTTPPSSTTSPAIVQGEVLPAVKIDNPIGTPETLLDPPPRLGIAAYLVGGVVGGRSQFPLENINVAIAACMMAWPIALAARWLGKRLLRTKDDAATFSASSFPWRGLAVCAMLILAVVFRQAWVVQLSLLAVYVAIVVFTAYALLGPQHTRCESQAATLAMLGWLVLSCGPLFGDHVRPYLPTTLAFKWIDQQLGCEPGQPGPDMALSKETEQSLRSWGPWSGRIAKAWPTIVASFGLDHRYPLSTPGTILMAFPAAWIAIYLVRRRSHLPSSAEVPGAS